MEKEFFEQEIRHRLREQRRLHPVMTQADTLKFVFQAMLGPGHLLASREKVQDFIAHEMETLSGNPEEPLLEILSPDWCRLNLRRAKAEWISPSVIAGLMLTSPAGMPFSRQDVFNTCIRLAESEGESFSDPDFLRTILDENRLPSHSTVYREQECPAYRVVSAAWIPLSEAICRMARIRAEVKRPLVTIDGPCASGKTTLAEKLARVFDAAVVHTDDFVIPHSRKTPERLAVPGGNCDAERLAQEVAAPWKQGKQIRYRKYDCHLDQLQPQEKLPDCGMLILEGSYSNLPILREYADLSLYVDTPEDIRFARLQERESPESLLRFQERWIPLENAYFNAYGIPDPQFVIIRDPQKSI